MKTATILILDRSGSMETIRSDVPGGINDFFRKQKESDNAEDGIAYAVQFDYPGQDEVLFDWTPIPDVPEITLEDYRPRGSTALIDCVCNTIDKAGKYFASLPEEERPQRVFCLIMTDGYENTSTRFSKEEMSQRIQHQTDNYAWEFVYLGADHDAIQASQNYGLSTASSAGFAKRNFRAAAANAGGKAVLYAGTLDLSEAKAAVAYSDEERRALGAESESTSKA